MLQVIIKVNWFRAEYKGSRATMRRELSGFWSVDSTKLLRASKEPYILPVHVQQAFFYKNPNSSESSWWQIIHINPRGRRIFDSSTETLNSGGHIESDGNSSDTLSCSMHVVNETLAIVSEEIQDQEDKEEDPIATESEDSSEFEELQLELPLDVTKEEHQELRADIENSNIYINIYNGDST
jgi:hypothetical protein